MQIENYLKNDILHEFCVFFSTYESPLSGQYFHMPELSSMRISLPPVCCHLSMVGAIVYLNDPDSYAAWSFYTPVRASKARQVEG